MTINVAGRNFSVSSSSDAPVDRLPMGAERRGKKKSKAYYIEDFGCFDIETTSCITARDKRGRFQDGFGFMYIWQFYSQGTGLVIGRYWSEFIELLRRISDHYGGKASPARFVIWIHNAAFEHAFMADQLKAAGIRSEVFAVRNHKPLSIRLLDLPIEFRCSYKLTNRGLGKYLSDMSAAGFAKMTGDLDYRIQRTPKSELTPEELGYCAVDVAGLYAALKLDMQLSGDTPASIPLTSTGYVRREYMNEVVRPDKNYQCLVTRSALTWEQFRLVTWLAAGGDTLACASQKLGDIFYECGSADEKSAYPAQLCTEPYPQGKLEYEGCGEDVDLDYLLQIREDGRYFITTFRAWNVEVKEKLCPIPCLMEWKAHETGRTVSFNGRILKTDMVSYSMDMITFGIFLEQYTFESIEFGDTYSCEYAPLPETVRKFVMKYFRLKCELDDRLAELEKGTEEYENLKLDRILIKNKLNGIYGMFYTNPCHPDFDYDDELQEWGSEMHVVFTAQEAAAYYMDWSDEELKRALKSSGQVKEDGILAVMGREQLLETLAALFRRRLFVGQITAVGPYLWGVHTAALGRFKLWKLIEAVGPRNVIYSDTDSVKYRINEKSLAGLKAFNDEMRQKAIDNGAYVDTGKNVYYLGVADDDGFYQEFVTLGAKKYCYRDKDGLHITVSGVQKEQVCQLNDDIRNFNSGMVFDPAGGIMLHYIEDELHTVHVVGDDGTEDEIIIGNNVCCEERLYALSSIDDLREEEALEAYAELFGGESVVIDDIDTF